MVCSETLPPIHKTFLVEEAEEQRNSPKDG